MHVCIFIFTIQMAKFSNVLPHMYYFISSNGDMCITNSALCFLVGFEGHLESGREHNLPDYSIYLEFFSLWLSWLTPASPQDTVLCPLASGARRGDMAANRSATRHPEGIELALFHVSGSPDSCCSMEVAEMRDPIKGPSPASFQQQMPQCPALSSPVSPNILLQS